MSSVASEEAKVAQLHAALQECDSVTRQMNSVLGGLETKLRVLQDTLRPLQSATKEVARAESNINLAMDEMQRIMEHYKLASETTESASKRELRLFEEETFLVWVRNLINGRQYLSRHSLSTSKLSDLAKVANTKMETHVREILVGLRSTARRSEDKLVAIALDPSWCACESEIDDSTLWSWTSIQSDSISVFRTVASLKDLLGSDGSMMASSSDADALKLANSDFPLYVSDAVMTSTANVLQQIEATAAEFHSVVNDNICEMLAKGRSSILCQMLQTSLSDDCLNALLYASEWCYMNEQFSVVAKPADEEEEEEVERLMGIKTRLSSEMVSPLIVEPTTAATRTTITDADTATTPATLRRRSSTVDSHVRSAVKFVANSSEDESQSEDSLLGDDVKVGEEEFASQAFRVSVRHHPLVLLCKLFGTFSTIEYSVCNSMLRHTEKIDDSEYMMEDLMSDVLTPALRIITTRIQNYLTDSRAGVTMSSDAASRRETRGVVSSMKVVSALKLLTQKLADRCQDSLELGAFDSLLVRVDLVFWLRRLSKIMSRVCGSRWTEWKSLVDTVREDCGRMLNERVSRISSHDTRDARSDGGTHPLTIDCASLMQNIVDNDKSQPGYRDICNELYRIGSKDASEEKHSSSDDGDRSRGGDYLMALRTALVSNIMEKSKHYSSKQAVLQCVFELNNLDYLSKSRSVIECADKSEMETFRKQVVSLKKKYLDVCWGPLASLLTVKDKVVFAKKSGTSSAAGTSTLSVASAGGHGGAKLGKSDRNRLKTRFTSVNQELATALGLTYVIPDAVLRSDMCSMTIDYILPLYQDFWRKYYDVHFTERKEKYFKIEPSALETRLKALFDSKI